MSEADKKIDKAADAVGIKPIHEFQQAKEKDWEKIRPEPKESPEPKDPHEPNE